MALSAPEIPDGTEVERRHLQWSRELKEMEQAFLREGREELATLEAAKHALDVESQTEREYLISQLPGGMTLPELFGKYLAEKKAHALAMKQDEYEKRKAQREALFAENKLKHLNKWRTSLFTVEGLAPAQPQLGPAAVAAIPSILETPTVIQRQVEEPPAAPGVSQLSSGLPPVDMARTEQSVHIPSPRAESPRVPASHDDKVAHTFPSQSPKPVAATSLSASPPAPRRTPLVDRSPARAVPTHGTDAPASDLAMNVPRQRSPQATGHADGLSTEQASLPDTITVSSPGPNPGPTEAQKPPLGRNPLPSGQPASLQHQKPAEDVSGTKAQKRKSFESMESNAKRPRVEAESFPGNAASSVPQHRRQQSRKTITFDEVYQNGNPQYKHIIVEYPAQSSAYYILRCDEHGVHFNLNPLAGAAKHLHSAQHGHMTKERAQAVELLGYLVVDCTAVLAEKNNQMVRRAFTEGGYKPLNLNQLSKSSRISLGYAPDPPSAGKSSAQRPDNRPPVNSTPPATVLPKKPFNGVINPIPGQLYLSYWAMERRDYVVVLLPWGDLDPAGLSGTLLGTGLLDNPPKCYELNHATRQIKGWAPGYQDGGPYVHKREFPVFYFDGNSSVGWVPARDLSEFDFDTTKWRLIPYFLEALNHYAKSRGFESFDQMRLMAAGRELKTFRRSQLDYRPSQATHPPSAAAPASGVPPSAPRTRDHEMADRLAIQPDDSDKDSVTMTDSDNDVEMANTDSRRTSVSNRGEAQGNPKDQSSTPSAPAPVPGSILAAPRIETPRQNEPGRDASAQPAITMSLADQAQLIAAKALHLQYPGHDIPVPSRSPREAEFRGGVSKNQDPPSRQSSVSSTEQGHTHRRVEKIYAHSNPNRTSRSPGTAAAPLPDKPSSPAITTPRVVSSPASLQNILQRQPSHPQPRPGPLSQPGFLAETQQSRRSTPPMLLPVPVPGGPNQRPLVPRILGSNIPRLPSPLHILPSHGPVGAEQQPARSGSKTPTLPSNPTSRSSTPVVSSGNEANVAERWRAVRTASQSIVPPPASVEPQGETQPVRSPLTPSLSASNATAPRSTSPLPIKAEYQPFKANTQTFQVALFPESVVTPTDSDKPGKVFWLAVGSDDKVAKSSADAPEEFVVDPKAIKQVVVIAGKGIARMVKIVTNDNRHRTLMFDASDTGFGVQSGTVHARRFCRWITTVNNAVDYNNTSIDPGRRSNQAVMVEPLPVEPLD